MNEQSPNIFLLQIDDCKSHNNIFDFANPTFKARKNFIRITNFSLLRADDAFHKFVQNFEALLANTTKIWESTWVENIETK